MELQTHITFLDFVIFRDLGSRIEPWAPFQRGHWALFAPRKAPIPLSSSSSFFKGPRVRFMTVFAPGGAPGVAVKSDSGPARATLPGLAREV